MQRFRLASGVGFALGMIALGVIGLVFRDFSLVWGRVPAWVQSRPAFAVAGAAVPLVAGIALLFRPTAAAASRVLVVYVGLWWLLLKVTLVIGAPLKELTWLVTGMYGMLLAGAWTLVADLGRRPFPADQRSIRLARLFFGLCLIPVGLSHFVYLDLTAPLVPSYLPWHVAWAYFTGACHLAAGLGILFGVLPRLAARLEAAMLGIFSVFVWIPAVIAAPGTRRNWTELWVSWALTAATAVVAVHVPPDRQATPAGAGAQPTTKAAVRWE